MSLVRNIVVLGNDEHAWFSAALLAFNCPWSIITVIGKEESGKGFYTASTRGECQSFFNTIGFPWQELLFSASATYKLANRYVNCRDDGLDFFHSHGAYGKDIGLLEFHQIVNALSFGMSPVRFDAYAFESQAAKSGKFIVNHGSAWGLHYDRLALTRLLKIHAQNLGVKYISEDVASINCDSLDVINEITTESGAIYSADFYINAESLCPASLENSCIADSWIQSGSNGWCLTAYLRDQDIYLPVTEYSRTDDQCWIKKVPLQSQTAIEIRGVDSAPQQQDFLTTFNNLGISVKEDSVRLILIGSGRKNVFWAGNCLGVGEASVSLGGLSFPALDFTKFQVEKFLKYFPGREHNCNLVAEYNRVTVEAVDGILDHHNFISSILLKDEIMTNEFKDLSPSLADRIKLFVATGRYELRENELMSKDEWVSLFMGLGIPINQQDPLLSINELAKLGEILESINTEIIKTIDEMPNHLIFLSQFLKSKNKR